MIVRRAELPAEAAEVLAVQRAAYAVEAELIGHPVPIGPLEGEEVWVAEVDGAVAGVLGLEGRTIARLAVSPSYMRRGIGRALVEHALSLGAGSVGTAAANAPALALYASLGFSVAGESVVGDGLAYVTLRRGP